MDGKRQHLDDDDIAKRQRVDDTPTSSQSHTEIQPINTTVVANALASDLTTVHARLREYPQADGAYDFNVQARDFHPFLPISQLSLSFKKAKQIIDRALAETLVHVNQLELHEIDQMRRRIRLDLTALIGRYGQTLQLADDSTSMFSILPRDIMSSIARFVQGSRLFVAPIQSLYPDDYAMNYTRVLGCINSGFVIRTNFFRQTILQIIQLHTKKIVNGNVNCALFIASTIFALSDGAFVLKTDSTIGILRLAIDSDQWIFYLYTVPEDATLLLTSSERIYCLHDSDLLNGILTVSLCSFDGRLGANGRLSGSRNVQFPRSVLRKIHRIIDYTVDDNGYVWMVGTTTPDCTDAIIAVQTDTGVQEIQIPLDNAVINSNLQKVIVSTWRDRLVLHFQVHEDDIDALYVYIIRLDGTVTTHFLLFDGTPIERKCCVRYFDPLSGAFLAVRRKINPLSDGMSAQDKDQYSTEFCRIDLPWDE